MEFSRRVSHRYVDALDHIWITCAQRIGLVVRRTSAAYATTDGRGGMGIGVAADLDADDNMAQMVFHELCHSLVEGPDSFAMADWGLCNETDEHHWREHACLRAQAVIAAGYGLRRFFAPTTDFRAFYDELPADPLAAPGAPSVALAMSALQRAERHPWAPHLRDALDATSSIVETVATYAGKQDTRDDDQAPALYQLADPRPPPHPLGFAGALANDDHTCGDCGWRYLDDDDLEDDELDDDERDEAQNRSRCHQADGAKTQRDAPACDRWQPEADCLTCGACCREAYHSVTVDDDDPVIDKHPSLIVHRETYKEIRRDGDRCSMLSGGPPGEEDYTCAIYDDRPRCCADLERGGEHCLTARRRVGLSR